MKYLVSDLERAVFMAGRYGAYRMHWMIAARVDSPNPEGRTFCVSLARAAHRSYMNELARIRALRAAQ